jgi:hypothetical protein
MKSNTTSLEICKYVLGLLLTEQLPEISVNLLEDGYDSSELRKLSVMTPADRDAIRVCFEVSLQDVGIAKPSKAEAVVLLATAISKDILSGIEEPRKSAGEIWDLTLLLEKEHLVELDPFIYAASEWENRPDEYRLFEEMVFHAAKELVRKIENKTDP